MKLKKELGFWDVFSISSGAMISSGIFILPGIAFAKAGPSIILSYILGGVIALMGIAGVIELTTAMPKAGGDYFFINRTLGPLVGTVSGVLSWFAISLKAAFAVFGISEVIGSILYNGRAGSEKVIIISIIVTVFFVCLNIIGVEFASKFETLLVFGLIILIVLYIFRGIFYINTELYTPFIQVFKYENGIYINGKSFGIFDVTGLGAIFGTTAFIFVSFGGLLKAASISEEIKNPGENIPRGLISSIVVITILYTLILIVTIGIINGTELANSLTPIADSARIIAGKTGYYIITVAAMLAFISTANAGIMAASRYPLALSRDKLFPEFINKVHPKFQTPIISLSITGAFIIFSLFLKLETLAKTASAVILLTYILTNFSVIIIRESNMVNYQPIFKAPFYPWLQLFTIVVFSLFIGKLGYKAVETSIGLILISVVIYFSHGRKNATKQYAFLHLLIRITESLNLTHELESELRDLIHERDDVELDKFDDLVKNAVIMDLKGPLTLDELFELQAESLKNILKLPKLELINFFKLREEEVTTALTDFTAIPHIVLSDRADFFHMVIVRCKEGIKFNEKRTKVKAVFLFISSKDLRKTHLHTLASIAALIREDDFREKWLEAKNTDYIRDMVLLSKRERNKK